MWKKILFVILILASFTFIGFWMNRDKLADLAWNRSRQQLALFLNNQDQNLFMELGDYYFNRFGMGEYDLKKAERAYQKALSLGEIESAHYQLARIYLVKNDLKQALSEINKELEISEFNLRPLYVRGLINAYRNNLQGSADDFRRFIEWAPTEWAGYNDLAWVLAKQGKYREVKEVMYSALDLVTEGEKNPWLWNSLGVALLNLKEHKDAYTAFVNAQKYSTGLTLSEWRRAYPGNDPAAASSGLKSFHKAIAENISVAEKAIEGI